MSSRHFPSLAKSCHFLVGVALCVALVGASVARGQFSGSGMGGAGTSGGGMGGGGGGGGGGRHGGGRGSPSDSSEGGRHVPPPATHVELTPHGGEYITAAANDYEIVFMPMQTRIYCYDKLLKPLSARDVHVQMSMQVPNESGSRRIPFQYVALPAGSFEQDYVAAGFEIARLNEGETPIAIEFSQLADRHHPTASFAPLFSKSKVRPYVAQVLVTAADRQSIARQRVCPVNGEALGSRGPVIKVLVGEYPLYLCCDECMAAVERAPERFLPRSAPGVPAPGR
jgi:hypothetical protein